LGFRGIAKSPAGCKLIKPEEISDVSKTDFPKREFDVRLSPTPTGKMKDKR